MSNGKVYAQGSRTKIHYEGCDLVLKSGLNWKNGGYNALSPRFIELLRLAYLRVP